MKTTWRIPSLLKIVLVVVVVVAADAQQQTRISVSGPGCARIPPSAPTRLRAEEGDRSVRLSWREPANGACVDEYEISVRDLSATAVGLRSADRDRRESTKSFEVVIDDLINGHEYELSVTAKSDAVSGGNCQPGRLGEDNAQRVGSQSSRRFGSWWTPDSNNGPSCWDTPNAVATVRATPESPYVPPQPDDYQYPGAPARMVARSHDRKVTLSWDSPSDDGGCEIEGYSVDVMSLSPSTRTFGMLDKIFSLEHEVVIEDLINCEDYRFEVRAENCKGWGPARTVVATPIPTNQPTVVTPVFLGMWCP